MNAKPHRLNELNIKLQGKGVL